VIWIQDGERKSENEGGIMEGIMEGVNINISNIL